MRVLVLDEKHGHDYFAVPVDKEGVVMLHVIKERHKRDWYEGTMDEKEEELLKKCVEEDDFKAAIQFFRLRRNAEYEGWDLIEAKILPGAQYAYSPLPKGCRARFEAIGERAEEIMETFINGNRKDALKALEEMATKEALAVLAEIVVSYDQEYIGDLYRFLKEMA